MRYQLYRGCCRKGDGLEHTWALYQELHTTSYVYFCVRLRFSKYNESRRYFCGYSFGRSRSSIDRFTLSSWQPESLRACLLHACRLVYSLTCDALPSASMPPSYTPTVSSSIRYSHFCNAGIRTCMADTRANSLLITKEVRRGLPPARRPARLRA